MPPPARLLDITRIMRRAGRQATGIDRVELAYLRHLLTDPSPFFTLARLPLGYAVLDRSGSAALLIAAETGDWGRSGLLARLSRKATPAQQQAMTFIRKRALARATPRGLQRLLRRTLPAGFTYLNVGHSNLTSRVLGAVRALPKTRISVMIHDTIPLDWPDKQRPGTVADFAAKLRNTATYADLVLCVSRAAQADVARHMAQFDRVPPMFAAHLGLSHVAPDPTQMPKVVSAGPYFVAVGTLEPRKNHALLLDIWAARGHELPPLYLCGARGWANADLFARLDRGIPGVTELGALSDPAMAALVAGAQGLLFPSLAEGYGLPAIEALAVGTPVICADLPVFHEVLGESGVYAAPTDRYQWENKIKRLAEHIEKPQQLNFAAPTWAAHFKAVLTMT